MKKTATERFLEISTTAIRWFFMALTFGLLFVALFRKDWILQFLAVIERVVLAIGDWNYLLAFTLAIVESFPVLGVVFPGMQAMLLVGGFFGRSHLPEMIAVASVGAIVGNFVGYALGRRYGKGFFHHYGDALGIGRTELRYLERQIAKNGPWFVVFGKFHNFARAFVPFIAGSGEMHPKRFWIYNVVGSIVWASTIVTLGVAFAAYYQKVVDSIGYVFFALLLGAFGYVWFFQREAFMRYLKEKRQEIEEKETSRRP